MQRMRGQVQRCVWTCIAAGMTEPGAGDEVGDSEHEADDDRRFARDAAQAGQRAKINQEDRRNDEAHPPDDARMRFEQQETDGAVIPSSR